MHVSYFLIHICAQVLFCLPKRRRCNISTPGEKVFHASDVCFKPQSIDDPDLSRLSALYTRGCALISGRVALNARHVTPILEGRALELAMRVILIDDIVSGRLPQVAVIFSPARF